MKRAIYYGLLTCMLLFAASSGRADEQADSLKAAIMVEDALSSVVDHAKSSVVVIVNKQYQRQPQVIMDDFPDFFNFPRRMRRRLPDEQRLVSGFGSGVIVDTKGYVVTNHHVIKDYDFLEVKLEDGTVYDTEKDKDSVKVIGVDEETDLAVLQLCGDKKKTYSALAFADSDKLRVGQWAIAIGAPFELEHSVTIGHISQTGRHNMGMATFDNYIQTDASINPGNSGGPLLNIKGEIIGINQFIVTGGGQSRGNVGLGFSIASNLAKQVVDDLIANGVVNRSFLGVGTQALTNELKEQFNAEYGVIVSEVLEGEAADEAGVKAGDIILKVGDKRINSSRELLLAVTSYKPGDTIPLTILRDEKEIKMNIKAGKRELHANAGRSHGHPSSQEALEKLGVVLKEDDGVVRIVEILPDGAIANVNSRNENQIVEGDVILDVNRIAVHSVRDIEKALQQSKNNSAVFLIEHKVRGQQAYRFFVVVSIK